MGEKWGRGRQGDGDGGGGRTLPLPLLLSLENGKPIKNGRAKKPVQPLMQRGGRGGDGSIRSYHI